MAVGVELGDINSKLGGNAIDNGYMRLNHHRIPRTNLLMKYCQVLSALPGYHYITLH